jgi:hypothetical protein
MYSSSNAYWLVEFILLMVNVLVAYFSKVYLSEQLESIESNTTLVETYQNTRGEIGIDNFRIIFGPNPLLWPFPIYTTDAAILCESVFSNGAARLTREDADVLGIDASPRTLGGSKLIDSYHVPVD